MKKFVAYILCLIFVTALLCSCNTDETTATPDTASSNAVYTVANDDDIENGLYIIEGVWVCKDISDDCYFVFKSNGDAFAKMGTCTIYGTFEPLDDAPNTFDIDLGEFFYNEYTAVLSDKTLTLKSDTSQYKLTKTTLPDISAGTPDASKTDTKLIGDWQSENSYECYRFNADGTAVITDMYNMATIDCIYECKDSVVTLHYMASEQKTSTRTMKYSVVSETKIKLDDIEYEKV